MKTRIGVRRPHAGKKWKSSSSLVAILFGLIIWQFLWVVVRNLQSGTLRGSTYAPMEEQDKEERRQPWRCSYYDNERGVGSPMATLEMDYVASDWQKQVGWAYDGVPILNDMKSGFYLKCCSHQPFRQGTYAFAPYAKLDFLLLTVDGKEIYRNEQGPRTVGPVIEVDPIFFEETRESIAIEITAGVLKEERSWIMLSWSRVHYSPKGGGGKKDADFTYLEKIACAASPICQGPLVKCSNMKTDGLGSSEAPWGLCHDFVAVDRSCLVYSFGVREIYTAELLYGREGCEVHAFDCTINHPAELGPNVTFHPWCLGTDSSELKLDGKGANTSTRDFFDLPAIISRLGHEQEELTVLKMDCEGCEWDGLDLLSRKMPAFFSRIRILMLEMHFITNAASDELKVRKDELMTMSRVADSLQHYQPYRFSINSDLSIGRLSDPIFYKQLYDVGLLVGACCYEFSMVRRDLISSRHGA